MAVVSCEEIWEGRRASASFDGNRTYTRVFEVRTDDPDDGPAVVGAAAGLPAKGQPYLAGNDADAAALCSGSDPEQDSADPTLWRVTVSYTTDLPLPDALQPAGSGEAGSTPSGSDPAAYPESPLLRPPVWKVSFEKYEEPAVEDYDQKPIVNSAGLPFNPPVMRSLSLLVATVTYNEATCDLMKLWNVQDTVNESTWKGFGPRMVRFDGAEAETAIENGVRFFRITARLVLRRPNWDRKVLNAGFMEKKYDATTATHHWEKITDRYGREPSEPVPLAADGTKLAPGGTPIFLTLRMYPEVDFASYLLP